MRRTTANDQLVEGPEAFVPFDVADYIQSALDISLYMEAVLEDGTANDIAVMIHDITRASSRMIAPRSPGGDG